MPAWDMGSVVFGLGLLLGLGVSVISNPIEVRLEGFLGGHPPGAKVWQRIQIQVGQDKPRYFEVINLIVLSPGRESGADLLASRRPTRPNFILAGEEKLLERIRGAGPDQFLRIRGNLLHASRWILVNAVERSPPGIPPEPTLRERLLGF